MRLKPIKTKKEYAAYLDWVDELFDKKVKPNSTEGEQLQVALLLIKQYEDEHYPVSTPDPIEAINLKMAEKGLKIKCNRWYLILRTVYDSMATFDGKHFFVKPLLLGEGALPKKCLLEEQDRNWPDTVRKIKS